MAWNGSDVGRGNCRRRDVSSPKRGRGKMVHLLLGGSVLAVVCVIAFVFFGTRQNGGDSLNAQAKSHRIKQVSPAVPTLKTPSNVQEPEAVSTTPKGSKRWEDAVGLDPRLFPYTDGRKVIEMRTNKWMAVDICIMPDGARRKVRRNVSKQLFKHATDQILMQALATGGDEVGPPIPFSADMEDDFKESLKTPIVIDPDDTPQQREIKEQVIAARQIIKEALAQGRTFYDAVNDHIAAQADNQSARGAVVDAVEQLKQGGESDLIEDYLEKANQVLENMGASPILIEDISEDENEN